MSSIPLALPEIQVCEAENIDWFTGMIARRRNGALSIPMAGSSLTSTLRSLHRFLPTNLENDQQLFAFCRTGSGTAGLCARSVFGVWTPVAMLDASQDKGIVEAVSFNYKLFVAHKNINDRLEVFDPITSVSSFRRVGTSAGGRPGRDPHRGGQPHRTAVVCDSVDPSGQRGDCRPQ